MTQQSHQCEYNPQKTITEKYTCTPMFLEALYTIARAWNQPRCSLTDKWIKNLWYMYMLEYLFSQKKEFI